MFLSTLYVSPRLFTELELGFVKLTVIGLVVLAVVGGWLVGVELDAPEPREDVPRQRGHEQ